MLTLLAACAASNSYRLPNTHPKIYELGERREFCTKCHGFKKEPIDFERYNHTALFTDNHRMVAYAVTALVVWHGLGLIRSADDARLRTSAGLLIGAVAAQVVLGIWTLLAVVPVSLGVIHQTGAAILFGLAVRHLHLVLERPPERIRSRR